MPPPPANTCATCKFRLASPIPDDTGNFCTRYPPSVTATFGPRVPSTHLCGEFQAA